MNKYSKISHNDNYRLSNFLFLLMILLFFTNTASILKDYLPWSHSTISDFLKTIIAIYFCYIIPTIIRKTNSKTLIFSILSLIVSAVNILIFPNNVYAFNILFNFFSMCFSCGIVIASISNYNILIKILLKASYIISIICFFMLCGILLGAISISENNYAMGFGYSLQLPAMFLIYDYFNRNKLYTAFLFLIILSLILLLGSRGPLLGIILFCISIFFKKIGTFKNRKGFFYFAITIALIVFFGGEYFINKLESTNITSRTLYLLNNDITYTSGRDSIYSIIISEIQNDYFAIRGIGAEYFLVGTYAHNILLEILYQFGGIIGGFLVLILVFLVAKSIIVFKLNTNDVLIIIFMFASLPSLMVSGSFWMKYEFWLWLLLTMKKTKFSIK